MGGISGVGVATESVRTRSSVAVEVKSIPQAMQKLEPSAFSAPQAGHLIILQSLFQGKTRFFIESGSLVHHTALNYDAR